MADNLTPMPVKTKAAGDVKVDIAEYNDSAVGASNAIHVQAGTGATFPVTDNSGSLTVDNAGTFASQDTQVVTDNAGFTDGTTKVFVNGYIYDEVAGTALTENDAAAARINLNRAQVQVIEDGATRGRWATVTASNAVKVDGSGVTQPVSGTVTASQATASSLNAEVQGDAAHDAPVSGNPILNGAYASAAAPSDVSGDGDVVRLWADRAGRLQVGVALALPAGNNNIGDVDIASALPAGNNNIGDVDIASAIPAGNNNIGDVDIASIAAGDNVIGRVKISDGTNMAAVRDTGSNDSLCVNIVDASGNQITSFGGEVIPTTPVMDPKTSSALAAGSSVDVDSTDVGSATKKLTQLIITSSVPWRAELKTVANAVATTRAYFFGRGLETVVWDAPHRNFVTQGPAGAGFDGFRLSMKNMDNVDAGDVYCTFVTQE